MVEIISSILIGFMVLLLFSGETMEKDLDEIRVPDMPSKLKLEATLSTISISWLPPVDTTIPIKGYIVGWGTPVPYDFTKALNANQTHYQLTGLSPTTEYVVSVRAFNDHGDGPPKYETIWTRAPSTPEPKTTLPPPIGLRVDVPSPTSVVLHWTDTTLNSRNPTDDRVYTIRYSSSFMSNSPKYRYINTTRTSLLIEDLKAHTQYEFAVKTIKGRRETTWSMSALSPLPMLESNQEKTEEKIVSNLKPFHSMIFLISSISGAVLLLVIAVSILFIKSRRSHGPRHDHDSGRKHNGYIAAATSPVGGGKHKSNIELKPPDLWIHHNDQMEVFW